MIRREVSESPSLAGARGAELIAQWSREALKQRAFFSIALAGGEAPKGLYESLATRDDIDFKRWRVLWGDERFVPVTDSRSNAFNARKWLLDRVPVPSANIWPMALSGLDLNALASRYEEVLDEALGVGGALDLVLLGVGKDAHTLSLYPNCPAITETTRRVVALANPPMDPAVDRISFTPVTVRSARRVMVVAHGASKTAPLRAVLEGPDDRMGVPCQLIRDVAGEVVILTDRAAVGA